MKIVIRQTVAYSEPATLIGSSGECKNQIRLRVSEAFTFSQIKLIPAFRANLLYLSYNKISSNLPAFSFNAFFSLKSKSSFFLDANPEASTMKAWLASVVVWVINLSVLFSCTGDPTARSSAQKSNDKLCGLGGAQYDQARNECICPEGFRWNGTRCSEGMPTPAPAEALSDAAVSSHPAIDHHAGLKSFETGDEGNDSDDEHEHKGHGGDESELSTLGENSLQGNLSFQDVASKLKVVCRRAGGYWVESESYCHCSRGQVIVGQKCRTLPGRVTDDACLRAIAPGSWQDGRCECAQGLVFSPARGGCVPPRPVGASVVLSRRICESSLNNGKWDARHNACRCPTGEIAVADLCQPKERFSSREVCEGNINSGQWNAQHKRCECAPGRVWVDQSCKPTGAVDPKTACEREASGGRYDLKLARCICPGLTRWREEERACR